MFQCLQRNRCQKSIALIETLQILFLFSVPLGLIWLEPRNRLVCALGPVVFCYGIGIAAANIPGVVFNEQLTNHFVEATVVVALPMLLFPSDLKGWLRLARPTVISFALAIISICLMSAVGVFFFADGISQAANISGMLVGVYTGGTPNMSAIAMALDVDRDTFILVNAADLLMGSLYLLFLMTLAKPLLTPFFPAFDRLDPATSTDPDAESVKPTGAGIVKASILSVLLVAVAAGVSQLLFGKLSAPFVILAITSLAIAASFNQKIRALPGAYEAGQYLLLIFCLAIGTLANISDLIAAISSILGYCAVVLFGSILLHMLLARLFNIDLDTFIITSTAAVFGPPFVGPIAKVLDNREIVISGITAGVVGLAIGNYLGYAVAMALAE